MDTPRRTAQQRTLDIGNKASQDKRMNSEQCDLKVPRYPVIPFVAKKTLSCTDWTERAKGMCLDGTVVGYGFESRDVVTKASSRYCQAQDFAPI